LRYKGVYIVHAMHLVCENMRNLRESCRLRDALNLAGGYEKFQLSHEQGMLVYYVIARKAVSS